MGIYLYKGIRKQPFPKHIDIRASLLLKTSLGLSKMRYECISKFAKTTLGIKLLQPWATVMEYRNSLVPPFSNRNWTNGYLSASVSLKDSVSSDFNRISELPAVKMALEELGERNIECVLHVTGGVDSATGFSHYSQANIRGKDDSLLSEHVMSLLLVSEDGRELWRNPNPQSDRTCRVRSMNWTKETDVITRQMF